MKIERIDSQLVEMQLLVVQETYVFNAPNAADGTVAGLGHNAKINGGRRVERDAAAAGIEYEIERIGVSRKPCI